MKETKCDACGTKIIRDKRVKVKGLGSGVNHFCDKDCLVQWMTEAGMLVPSRASQMPLGGFLLSGGTSEPPAKQNGVARRPDPLFEALARLDGGPDLTPTAKRAVAVALAGIKRATPDVTPDMIAQRAGNLALHFPACTVTASSLSKHWARCGSAPENGHRNGRYDPNHNIATADALAWDEQARRRIDASRI